MSDTVKLIIEIPQEIYSDVLTDGVLYIDYVAVIGESIKNGIPLDEVKAEIKRMDYHMIDCDVLVSQEEVLDIIEKYKGVSE